MKSIKLLALTLFSAMMLTSCLNSDKNEEIRRLSFTNNITRVTNRAMSTETLRQGTIYTFSFNTTVGTADIGISNLVLDQGLPSIGLSLKNLKYGYNSDGALEVKAAATTSIIGNEVHEITNFSFLLYTRTVPQIASLAETYAISFTVDGTHDVTIFQSDAVHTGITQVTPISNGDLGVTSDYPYYAYQLDLNAMTANLYVYSISLGSATFQQLLFRGLPITFDRDRVIISTNGPVTPIVPAGSVAPTVTDLYGAALTNCTMSLRFKADNYSVVATLGEIKK